MTRFCSSGSAGGLHPPRAWYLLANEVQLYSIKSISSEQEKAYLPVLDNSRFL